MFNQLFQIIIIVVKTQDTGNELKVPTHNHNYFLNVLIFIILMCIWEVGSGLSHLTRKMRPELPLFSIEKNLKLYSSICVILCELLSNLGCVLYISQSI